MVLCCTFSRALFELSVPEIPLHAKVTFVGYFTLRNIPHAAIQTGYYITLRETLEESLWLMANLVNVLCKLAGKLVFALETWVLLRLSNFWPFGLEDCPDKKVSDHNKGQVHDTLSGLEGHRGKITAKRRLLKSWERDFSQGQEKNSESTVQMAIEALTFLSKLQHASIVVKLFLS